MECREVHKSKRETLAGHGGACLHLSPWEEVEGWDGQLSKLLPEDIIKRGWDSAVEPLPKIPHGGAGDMAQCLCAVYCIQYTSTVYRGSFPKLE